MKSKLNQYSDLSCNKITVKTSPDSQNKKLELNMPDNMSTVSIERYTSQGGENSHEGTEKKTPSQLMAVFSTQTVHWTSIILERADRPNTIMKTQASTYALNTMRFNNKLSFFLVSSSMLIRENVDWHDNMSIMGVVRLKFLVT